MKKAVKKTKKSVKVENKEISELRKLAYIFGAMLIIFLVFYGIACLKMNSGKNKKEDIESTIQYNKILINNILNQNKDEYYVLVYNDVSDYNGYYYYYLQKYMKEEESLSTYMVDINDSFNKSYKSEVSNLYVDNILDIRINEDALLKINNGRIIEAYEGMENIANHLKEL